MVSALTRVPLGAGAGAGSGPMSAIAVVDVEDIICTSRVMIFRFCLTDKVRLVKVNVKPCKGSPRCLMVMTSDFYAMGIWRFRVRVPAGVLGNLFSVFTCCNKVSVLFQSGGAQHKGPQPSGMAPMETQSERSCTMQEE